MRNEINHSCQNLRFHTFVAYYFDMSKININDTRIAFEAKSNASLKETYYLFKLMNSPTLVNIGTNATMLALKIGLPVKGLIKRTIFKQFCGGSDLLECQVTIDHLAKYNTLSILDYGAEAKDEEPEFDKTMVEMIRVLEFASRAATCPIISLKVTGLARFGLLEKMDKGENLNEDEKEEKRRMEKRLDAICHKANELKMSVFVDAEESWIQDTVDFMVQLMMERYNKNRVTVYNTFQMYRSDRLDYLHKSHEVAQNEGYWLGAKLVRGAYMDKERDRAAEMGYDSPIQPDKESTDRDFNAAVVYCIENSHNIHTCVASHNADSCLLMAETMDRLGIPSDTKAIFTSQLLGMSDNLTFNFAKAGYTAAKYIPYGPVGDVIPYLIRRAKENTAVSSDMSRELSLLDREIKRRQG